MRHEFVTVTRDGFRFRQQMFDSVGSLFKWFKEHFRDPVPGGVTPSTPRINSSRTSFQGNATPSFNGTVFKSTILIIRSFLNL